MVYIKLFIDYLDALEPFGDAERGRLFTALLEYARTGEAPQLNGNERFIFPMMKAQIDRDRESQAETSAKRAAAGSAGGKQKQANLASDSKSSKCYKDKEEDKDKEEEKDEEDSPPNPPKGTRTRFQPPTVEEVAEYIRDNGYHVSAQRFVNHYTSNGWHVGKNPMMDWQAAVRTWESTEKEGRNDRGSAGNAAPERDRPSRHYDIVSAKLD